MEKDVFVLYNNYRQTGKQVYKVNISLCFMITRCLQMKHFILYIYTDVCVWIKVILFVFFNIHVCTSLSLNSLYCSYYNVPRYINKIIRYSKSACLGLIWVLSGSLPFSSYLHVVVHVWSVKAIVWTVMNMYIEQKSPDHMLWLRLLMLPWNIVYPCDFIR